MVKASILKDIETKIYYNINKEVLVLPTTGTFQVEALTAGLSGDLEGGAFNIFDQILKTNEFLRANTTTGSCSFCLAFSVAPKVTVYWKQGFNPGAYHGFADSGLSFFDIDGSLDNTPSLFILGGIKGDVNSSDTDHFDNSVIIHEYGHFLEASYSRSDSPGGSHGGNMIIDPRLAWSEGFANFLPSAVTGATYYIDTVGNSNGDTKANIFINLETLDGNDSIETKNPIGEGIYREVSISRALYDYLDIHSDQVIDPVGDNVIENSKLSFAYIWAAFTHPDYGIGNARNHFRSMGHFNAALKNILSSLSLTTELVDLEVARKGEFQTDDLSEFGLELKNKTSVSCTKYMKPAKSITVYPQGKSIPNIFLSSDFFDYYHVGGPLNLSLNYTPVNSADIPDLDLYLFYEKFSLDAPESLVGSSDHFRTDESPLGTEMISLSSLAPGYYMILVQAYTTTISSGGAANFDLKIGDQYLCQ